MKPFGPDESRLGRLKFSAKRGGRLAAAALAWLAHPLIIITLLCALGAACTVAAAAMLAGPGVALLTGGVVAFIAAYCVARGLSNG